MRRLAVADQVRLGFIHVKAVAKQIAMRLGNGFMIPTTDSMARGQVLRHIRCGIRSCKAVAEQIAGSLANLMPLETD